MIDTIYEVRQYIDGKNIVESNLYRICYLMVCWHKQQGYSRLQTREAIFEWGNKHNVWIRYKINFIINRVWEREQNTDLTSPSVRVSVRDAEDISRRFDVKRTRMVALAILCYAKAYADERGEFTISGPALSAWLGINRKTLYSRHIRELVDYGYIEVISKPMNNSKWEKSFDEQATRYRIKAAIENEGECVLHGNNLGTLYADLFCNAI